MLAAWLLRIKVALDSHELINIFSIFKFFITIMFFVFFISYYMLRNTRQVQYCSWGMLVFQYNSRNFIIRYAQN
jgi:hypothetical protein